MFDVNAIINTGGLLLIGLIVFAETGLLIGFFLPGDTLLLSAGIFAAQGKLNLPLLLLVVVVAAIIGDNTGYMIGKHGGKRLFTKKDSLLFRHEYVERAEAFYEKHGAKTIIFAKFIPVVRTFAAVVAGIGSMPRKKFVIYDIVGVLLWGVGVTMLGYWFGTKIPNIDHYIGYAVVGAMILTLAPTMYHLLKDPEIRAKLLRRK